MHASPAWWGSTSAADKQRLEASVRCGAIRLGLYTADDHTPSQLAAGMDDNLFTNIPNNPHHVLHKFLPRAKLIIQHKTSLVKTLRAHIRRPVCLNIEYVEDKIIDEFESRNLKQFLFLIIHTVLEVTLSDGAATNAMRLTSENEQFTERVVDVYGPKM